MLAASSLVRLVAPVPEKSELVSRPTMFDRSTPGTLPSSPKRGEMEASAPLLLVSVESAVFAAATLSRMRMVTRSLTCRARRSSASPDIQVACVGGGTGGRRAASR